VGSDAGIFATAVFRWCESGSFSVWEHSDCKLKAFLKGFFKSLTPTDKLRPTDKNQLVLIHPLACAAKKLGISVKISF
jgi:hypothetical protein